MPNSDTRFTMAGVLLSIIGLFFALQGNHYNFASIPRPRPGDAAFFLGCFIFITGWLVMAPTFFRKDGHLKVNWDILLTTSVSLLVFYFTFNVLGIFFSSIIATLIASTPKRMHWGIRLAMVMALALIASVIFMLGFDTTLALFPDL